jgi:hypothetical protein
MISPRDGPGREARYLRRFAVFFFAFGAGELCGLGGLLSSRASTLSSSGVGGALDLLSIALSNAKRGCVCQ